MRSEVPEQLPLIANWQAGGDAAKASLDRLSAYLAEHGERGRGFGRHGPMRR